MHLPGSNQRFHDQRFDKILGIDLRCLSPWLCWLTDDIRTTWSHGADCSPPHPRHKKKGLNDSQCSRECKIQSAKQRASNQASTISSAPESHDLAPSATAQQLSDCLNDFILKWKPTFLAVNHINRESARSAQGPPVPLWHRWAVWITEPACCQIAGPPAPAFYFARVSYEASRTLNIQRSSL
jgi:hypothetical protein